MPGNRARRPGRTMPICDRRQVLTARRTVITLSVAAFERGDAEAPRVLGGSGASSAKRAAQTPTARRLRGGTGRAAGLAVWLWGARCYLIAIGFTGVPTPPLNGCGDASSRNS
ncbi:hypothetical protein GCM10023205_56580 [Yinghuangia aomiensis]|uniref:Uncharacterized protein n=1 Tax=Yinghuangia aomiensis TaxID=676205 RepID=A0ABP9HW14_9ACTN